MSTTSSTKHEQARRGTKTTVLFWNRNRKQLSTLKLPTGTTNLNNNSRLQTPSPELKYARERNFILDCKAVSNISNDYARINPKLGSVIPPYVAQFDFHADKYFKKSDVKNTLEKTGQLSNPGSLAGPIYDRFHTCGYGFRYLSRRNKFGCGHSTEQVSGHDLLLSDPNRTLLLGRRHTNGKLPKVVNAKVNGHINIVTSCKNNGL